MVNNLKYIDKFLSVLKTDRNTFATYILTLFSVYLVVDRLLEMVFMFFTGISVSYWGPFKYTLAIACPVFAFTFSGCSKFANSFEKKVTIFNTYIIALYIIGISMAVQWINRLCWALLLYVPNYTTIVTEFSYLIRPAFQSIALYIPLTTFFPVFKFIFLKVNDVLDERKSINDYAGIDLSDKSKGWGPYTCEIEIAKSRKTGKPVKIPEARRFESTLIIGTSGSGKTSMVFEPMMARDLEKKFFFKEAAKEMGFTALRTGIATLECPYDNEYINKNFNLNMINPSSGKEKLFKAYLNRIIYSDSGKIIYKNIGFTDISPDYESISHVKEIADNYNIPVNIIDPSDSNSLGLNPFIHSDPSQTAIAISSVLSGMYTGKRPDEEEMYKQDAASQAVESLSILLKLMYPKLNNGLLPNLEDMLNMFNDFDLVEEMGKKLEADETLAKEYSLLIGYLKKHFYKTGSARQDTEKFVFSAATQLDNLLRNSGIRNILCNRSNNIDFDKALLNGEITLVCTRRGDLGAIANRAFGLFVILIMQYSILRRPGNERTRIPHFLYIDEFPDYICKSTEALFTLYRKYHVGPIVSAQNLDQLGLEGDSKFRQTIIANSTNKVVFGNNSPEDNAFWEKELGDHREWLASVDYDTSKVEYSNTYKSVKWEWKRNQKAGQIQALKFKQCIYKTKDLKGRNIAGPGSVDFLEEKYKKKHSPKNYNYSKFTKGISDEESSEKSKKKKFNPSKISFNSNSDGEIDPIKNNDTDGNYFFNNDEAIVFNFKNNTDNN